MSGPQRIFQVTVGQSDDQARRDASRTLNMIYCVHPNIKALVNASDTKTRHALLDAITVLDNGGARGADGGGCVQTQTDHQNPLYGLFLVATLMMVRRRR